MFYSTERAQRFTELHRGFISVQLRDLCELCVTKIFIVFLFSASVFAADSTVVDAHTTFDAHRIFIMPTASPIRAGGGFIGTYELGYLTAGTGIANIFSLTAGASVIPGARLPEQMLTLNAKFSVDDEGVYPLAFGVNMLWLSTQNLFVHPYAVATLETEKFRGNVILFYKVAGSNELTTWHFGNISSYIDPSSGNITFTYGNNLGAGFGIDGKIFNRDDLRYFGELWSHDLSAGGRKVAALLGIRVLNDVLSADFGIAIFTQPLVIPITNFLYRW